MNSNASPDDQPTAENPAPAFDPSRYRTGYIASAFGLVVTSGVALYGWLNTEPGEKLPIHYDASGQADRYGSRLEAFWIWPLMALGVSLLFALVPRIDPRRVGVAKSAKAYNIVWAVTVAFLVVVSLMATSSALGDSGLPLDGRLLTVASGILFAIGGNFMPKTGSNWFFGIRTPWTLSDDRVWADTHRMGGLAMLIGGGITVLAGLFAPASWGVPVLLIVTLGVGLITTAYSYFRYQSLHPA